MRKDSAQLRISIKNECEAHDELLDKMNEMRMENDSLKQTIINIMNIKKEMKNDSLSNQHDDGTELQLLKEIKSNLTVIEKNQKNKFSHIYQQNISSKSKLENIETIVDQNKDIFQHLIDSKFNQIKEEFYANQYLLQSDFILKLTQDLKEELIPIKIAMNELLMKCQIIDENENKEERNIIIDHEQIEVEFGIIFRNILLFNKKRF